MIKNHAGTGLLARIYIIVGLFFLIPLSVWGNIHAIEKKAGQVGSKTTAYPTAYIDKSVDWNTAAEIPEKKDVYHLLTHGRPGELYIEGEWKNPKQIADFLKSKIHNSNTCHPELVEGLSKDRYDYIYIYGCEFAKGDKGKQAVAYLERQLGVKIAASTNITGIDGDYMLEVGNFDVANVFKRFQGNLQCAGIVGGTNPEDDFDGDGICNEIDLDDDNDGIPDVDEGLTTSDNAIVNGNFGTDGTSGGNLNGWTVNVPGTDPTVTWAAQNGGAVTYVDGAEGYNLYQPTVALKTGDTPETVTFSVDVLPINAINVPDDTSWGMISFWTQDTAGNFIKLFTVYNPLGLASTTMEVTEVQPTFVQALSIDGDYSATSFENTGDYVTISARINTDQLADSGWILAQRNNGAASGPSGQDGADDFFVDNVSYTYQLTTDTDQDGIPDHLDLDSDGDGCSDSYEAGAIATENPDNQFTGEVGTNGLLDSLETSPDSGEINYSTTYTEYALNNELNLCVDTDGDGIGDLVDIDDDNDGVLDVDEELCGSTYQVVPGVMENADFTEGATGFYSELESYNETIGSTYDSYNGVRGYTATWNPYPPNGTREDPTNNYLVTNDIAEASGVNPVVIWRQTLNIEPNSDYVWVMDMTTSGVRLDFQINGESLVSGPIAYNSNNGYINYTWRKTEIPFNSETGEVTLQILQYNTSGAGQGDLGIDNMEVVSLCRFNLDTDNDGIPNRLDPDSDGDGCSDSYEAGATASETPNNQFTGIDSNSDGLVDEVDADNDGVPDYTSTYNQYALSDNLNLCADTDSDGIADLVDIDDDNDGVLDATESPTCFFQSFDFISGNRSEHITVTTGLNMSATYQNPEELVDGDNGTGTASYAVQFVNSQSNVDANIYTFEFATPVELTNIYLRYVNGNSHFTNNTVVQLRGSNNGETWTDLNPGITYGSGNQNGSIDPVPGTMRYNQFEVAQNQGRYKYYQIYGVSGTISSSGYSNEVYFQLPPDFNASSYPKADCTSDTDGDGVYNHHDLDSDGDGCSDSFEAGAIATETTDNQFTGTDTNGDGLVDEVDADSDGVPDYQYQSYAYNDSLNLCADTDNDGIGDLVDIDDDNDGVPDSMETTNNCGYVGAEDLSTYTFNNVASVNADFDENNNLSLSRINGTWVSTYSYQTVSVPLYLEFTVDDINSNSMVGIIEENANITSASWDDQSHKFHFNTNDDYNIRDFGSAALNADTYLPGDVFSIEVDEAGNLSMKKNGVEVYADTVTGTNFRLAFSTNSGVPKIYSNMVFGNTDEMVYACEDMDTDGDGTPNRLDPDSDGDGCSDSFEAGAIETENPDNQFTGEVGTNGLVDSLETTADSGEINYASTYSQYAISDNLDLCADTDGDGIGDLVDIDDDNDGVLDATESPDCFFESSDFISGERSENVTITTGLNMSATYQNPEELVDGDNGTGTANYAVQFINSQSNTGANIYTFEFATAVELVNVYLQYVNANSHFINGAVAQLRASNDGENWTDLNTGTTYNAANQSGAVLDIPGTIRYHQFEVAQNQGRYKYYQIYGVSGTIWSGGVSNEVYFELPSDFSASTYPKADCTSDLDGDGVYNHHDLDSDGDGCSDSFEAGAIETENPDNQFTGADTNSDGLVDEVDADQDGVPDYGYLPYAYSDNLDLCADTDGDGIGDLMDIDDDNDGVLDATESPDCFYTEEEVVFVEASSTLTNYNTNSAYSFEELFDGITGNLATYGVLNTPIAGETIYELEMAFPVELSSIDIIFNYSVFRTTAVFKWQGFNGTSWVDVTGDLSETETTNNTYSYTFDQTGTRYTRYRLLGVSGETYYNRIYEIVPYVSAYIPSLYPKVDCASDTDGDGVYNHHDLDSDGDDCPDAYEAGATTDPTMSEFTGEVGTNGLVDSLETTADSGEINYASTYKFYGQNANLNLCGDTDGDGIGDLVDLDDDNDGILDIDEGGCPDGRTPQSAFTNLSQIRNVPSGRYYFDLGNGVFQGDVDSSEDGGWLLVLQYVHQGGTNPALTTITPGTDFPVTSEATLGTNEAAIVENWGHAGNAALNQFPEDFEIRFYGESTQNPRIIHFKTTLGTDYIKTGTGSFSGINNTANHTLLTGHTANLPAQANNQFANQNNLALTNFPFYTTGIYHWGIRGSGTRWEVDAPSTASANSTIHRVWIRATTSSDCEPADTDQDGIPNHLDLDSDGDGCPDATEGDGGFTTTNLQTGFDDGGTPPQDQNLCPDGTCVDADGVPTIANGGQGVGTSQTASLDEDGDGLAADCDCYDDPSATDTDSDSVPDYADVDDDNDGIPDTEECSSYEPSAGDGLITHRRWDYAALAESNDFYSTIGHRTDIGTTTTQGDVLIPTSTPAVTNTLDFPQLSYTVTGTGGNYDIAEGFILIPFGAKNIQIRITATTEQYSTLHLAKSGSDLTRDPSQLEQVSHYKTGYSSSNVISTSQYTINGSNHGKWIRYALVTSNGTQNFGPTVEWNIDGAGWEVIPDTNFSSLSSESSLIDAFSNCEDTDGDGIADYLDSDSDNDGIPDTVEATGDETLTVCTYTDGNVIDTVSGCETGESAGGLVTPIDTDTDGIPDYLDLDSDEDGCPDGLEAGQDETSVNTTDYTQVTSSDVDANGLVTTVGCVSPTNGDWIDNTASDGCCEIDEATLVATPTAPTTCSPADDGYITITGGDLFPNTDYEVSYQDENGVVGPMIIPTETNGSLVITGLTPGDYTQITITSTSYPTLCQVVIETITTVPEFVNPVIVDTAVTNVSCFGGNNGAILLTVSGGSGNYTYSWTTTNGGGIVFGEDQTALQAGDYTVAVTDTQTQCTLTVENIPVAQPTAVVSGTVTQTNVQCFGEANGAIDLTPAGGTPPYTYSWTTSDGNVPAGQEVVEDPSGLTAGTYTVVITDANGCTNPTQINVTLTQPNELTLAEVQSSHQNVICGNGDIGTFTVAAGGGSGTGYEYSLDETDWTNTTGVFENLSPGTYNVWVRDSNACITGPLPIVIDLYCVEAVKTQALNDVDGSGGVTPGDVITYTIAIENTGTTAVGYNMTVDHFMDLQGRTLQFDSGPTFTGADQGSGQGSILAGETATFTATYTWTQADVDAGGLSNQAEFIIVPPTGTNFSELSDDDGGAVDTNDDGDPDNDPTVYPVGQITEIRLVKTANFNDEDSDGCTDVGETITYNFTVTNPGSVTLDNVDISDPLLANITFNSGDDNSDDELDVSETWTYTGTYTITQDDIDTGTISNQATVTAITPDGTSVSDLSGATEADNLQTETTLCQESSLALVKTANFNDENGDGCTDVGKTIGYTLTLTNTGNVSLDSIAVSDPMLTLTLGSGDTDSDDELDVSETWIYTGSYTITQDDIDTGTISNQATATATAPDGTSVSDLSGATAADDLPTETTLCQESSLALVKTANFNDENGDGCTDVGETIGYTLTLTNTGNVSLDSIAVSDPMLALTLGSGDTDNDTELDVSETWTYTGSYTITQDDIDAGTISNQATATASAPDGTSVSDLSGTTDADDLPTETTLCQESSLALIKTATFNDENGDGCTDVGETIGYDLTLTNTGNVSLDSIAVSDPMLADIAFNTGDDNGDTELNVTETWTYTGTYTITQDDIDAGMVSNQATATATAPDGTSVSDLSGTTDADELPTETALCQEIGMGLVKTGIPNDENGDGCDNVDETIAYTFTLTNTGNVSLNNVGVTDNLLLETVAFDSGDLDGDTNLDVDETWTYTGSYTIAQEDLDTGTVSNQATATASAPDGTPVSDLSGATDADDIPTETTLCEDPAMELIKEASVSDPDNSEDISVGDVITYTFTLTNTGNVTISGLTFTDNLTDADVGVLELTTGITFISSTGESDGTEIAPGEVITYRATYQIEQGAVDAGGVSNTATVNGTTLQGTDVSDVSDDGDPTDADGDGDPDNDPTVTPIARTAGLTLVKTASEVTDLDGNGQDEGDRITYTFRIENTGNVTIDNLVLTDDFLPGGTNLTLDETTLVPEQVSNFSVDYLLTATDIGNGEVVNSATIAGTDPEGASVSDVSDNGDPLTDDDNDGDFENDPTVVDLDIPASLSLIKTATLNDENGDGLAQEGETITYSFTVTNTGNITVDGLVIDDPQLEFTTPLDPVELAPGEEGAITDFVYTITQLDVDAGSTSNTATVTGQRVDPTGDEVTDISDDGNPTNGNNNPTVTPLPNEATVTLLKEGTYSDSNGDGMANVGDEIIYNFTVTNTGNVTLDNLVLTDNFLPVELDLTLSPTSIAPAETAMAQVIYPITQADVDAGQVSNRALVTGDGPNGNEVTADSDNGEGTGATIVPLPKEPSVNLIKTSEVTDTNSSGRNDAGDVVTYTFTVTNTGNVTVDMLTITDPRISVSNLAVNPSTLEPGETGTATATYTVTQLDMNRGSITNTATVNGLDPSDNPVEDISDNGTGTGDTPTITPLTVEPGIEVVKTQTVADTNGDGITGSVGDVISYTITITNPGNVTLRTITVTDTFTDTDGGALSLDSGPTFDSGNSDNIQGILRPGQQAVYTATYTITQAVVDAGGLSNTVEVEGTTETEVVIANDTIDFLIAENPVLEAEKTASISDEDNDGTTNAGDIITYTILVENTGNVMLTNVGLTDTLTDMEGTSLTLDSGPTFVNATDGSAEGTLNPLETATYTATYTLTQNDVNAGGVSNTATATATSPEGTPVEDISDDGDPANGDDNPTETLIEKAPELTLIKTVSNVADTDGSGDNNAGDVVTYTFSIENTGNVTIDNLVLTDDFLPGTTDLTVTPTTLAPGEEAVVSADYVLTQDDIDLGEIINSATISGTDPDTEAVTDVSDDGDPTDSDLDPDTDGDNDPTYLNLTTEASIYFDKVATVNDPNNNGQADAGETITYDFTVKNNGNITVENITFDDPNLGLTDAPITPSTLGPDQTGTGAQAQYTITQADIDAGFVVNDAIASGDRADGNGSVSDDSDDGNPLNGGDNPTRTDFDQNSSISLLKSGTYTDTNGDGVANVGDEIMYDFTVTNTGNTTVSGISVVDARIGLTRPGQNTTPNTLAPGEEGGLSITYPITQSDLNRRLVTNTATAGGTSPDGDPVTANSNIVVILLPKQPMLEHIKTSELIDANGNGVDDVGDQIEYTFTVTNTGNVTITVLSIDDPAIGVSNLGLVPSTLDPGEQGSATAVYDITQADVDAGEVVNSALVSGNDPDGETVDDPSDSGGGGGDDPTITPITSEPDYTVVKTQTVANTNGDTVTGGVDDIMTYTISVENTGNVTLTDIALTGDTFQDLQGNTLSLDSGPSFVSADQSSPEGTLVPDEIATYTATYIITQAAVDGGGLSNQATFTANPPSGTALTVISDDGNTTNGDDDPTLFPIEEILELEVIKKSLPITDTDNSGTTTTGDVLTFRITVANEGNVTLNTLALIDTLTDANGNELTLDSGPTFISSDGGSIEGTLVPGETATYEAVYTLQQSAINSGGVINTVRATALSPGGTSVEDISDDGDPLNGLDTPTEVDFELEPSLTLIKTSEVIDMNGNDANDADDTILYTFTVTNTGNVTVDNLTLNDPRLSATPVLTPTSLEPGESATATFSYDIQQGDINNGRVVNRAIVTGTDPDGEEVRDLSDDGSEFDSNNDGNPNNDPTITDLTTIARLELVKTAAYDPGGGRADVGETITYTFTLENTGYVTIDNLTITDPLLGIDSPEAITLSTPLDPGDTEILTISNVTYTITQEDIDNGEVSNTATVNGLYVANNEAVTDISDEGEATNGPDNPTVTPLPKAAEITLDKTGDFNDENTDGFADAGETVDYNFTITNTGNVTIDNLSLMDDFLPNGADVTLSLTTLPPGEVALAAATYTLTQTDVDNGEIINIAEATGTDPDGVAINAIDTVTVVLPQNPSLELIKTASDPNADTNNSGHVDAGDQIVYTFDVTNTGNVTVNMLTITDPRLPVNNLGLNPQTMAPGESGTVSYTYTITQADMDAGSITNTATVNGFDPSNGPVSDVSDNGTGDGDDPTVTPITAEPNYTVVKTQKVANTNIDGLRGGIGDRITYTITVENTGNVTLTGIAIKSDTFQDLQGNTLSLDSAPSFVNANQGSPEGTLVPDEIATYTATYTITQAAVDGDGLSNQATFTADPPSGTPIEVVSDDGDTTNGNENPTVFPIEETPSIEVLKIANVNDTDTSGSITAGDVITYSITVENTGNVTVNNLNLADTFTNGSGATLTPGFDRNSGASPEGTLAPGETATYSVTYTLTQEDIDVGGVSNTVTATATSSGGIPVDDISDDGNPADSDGDGDPGNDPTETLVAENPSIEAVKILTPVTNPVAGTMVEFTINVTNTGNVTLNNISLEDVLVDARGNTLTLTTGPDFQSADGGSLEGILQVGETATYTATYVLTQSDVDAGGISNGVIAKGTSVQGTEVRDKSDDGDDTDGNTTNDNTNLFIEEDPGIEITKPQPDIVQNDGNTTIDAGDVLDYTITVTNTGNVTLRNLVVTDTISDFNNIVLTPNPIPVFESSDNNNEGILLPNEAAIYGASYTITQNDVDAGGLRNHAFVTSMSPNNIDITDISDDDIDDDGNMEDDPTETEILAAPSITLIKTGVVNDEDGDGCSDAGETITYSFTVGNTGSVSLNNIAVTDDLLQGAAVFNGGDVDGDTKLDIDETWAYTGTYTITQNDIDDGLVSNQATVTANAPDETSVNDLSGTANDNDDITETVLCQEGNIVLEKEGVFNDENGDTFAQEGETVTYTFTVTNNGNVTIDNLTLTDDFLPVGTDLTLSPTTIAPEGTAMATAIYTLAEIDIENGGIINMAEVSGTDPDGLDVSITATDTVALASGTSSLKVTKTAITTDNGDGIVSAGDIIDYTITVTNTGDTEIDNIVLTDVLTDGSGNELTLTVEPTFVSADQGSPEGHLEVGETAEYLASYTLTQGDVDTGSVSNQVTADGTDIYGKLVSDLSGTDETNNNPTIVDFDTIASISLIKTAVFNDENGNGYTDVGETISYSFSVTNTGNVDLFDVTITEDLEGVILEGITIPILEVGETDSTTYSGEYTLTEADMEKEAIDNQAEAVGEDMQGNRAHDYSDDPNNPTDNDIDGDGDPDDSTDIIIVPDEEDCEVVVYDIISPNDDGIDDVLRIDGIDCYPNNTLEIYNRWGIRVFSTENYGAGGETFRGYSDGRATIQRNQKLPTGTYYYILNYIDDNGAAFSKAGPIYIITD